MATIFLGLNVVTLWSSGIESAIILGMDSANEKPCYNVTSSLIGWTYTQNDPCNSWQCPPVAMDVPLSIMLWKPQLWMLQCHSTLQPGCSILSDTDQPCSYGLIIDTEASTGSVWHQLTALISPWTKWPPFPRHFQKHFHEWKVLYFDLNFTEFCS